MTTSGIVYAEDVQPALIIDGSESSYVQETSTGLRFREDTPLEVWSRLVERLLTQHKRIEWAIADAINFGSRRYGEVYAQWVEQTQLAKKTLANIAWVGRSIESSRRREDVDFSYHAEVAALPPAEQDALLDAAVDQGMSRYDLREAARSRKRELAGTSVTIDGEVLDAADVLPWVPSLDDLTERARADVESHAPLGRQRSAWLAGVLWALVYGEQRDLFREGAWRL